MAGHYNQSPTHRGRKNIMAESSQQNRRRYVQEPPTQRPDDRAASKANPAPPPQEGMAKARVGTRYKGPAILVSKTTRQAKNGEPFTEYRWQDQSGQIDGKWFNTDDTFNERGRAYVVDAMVSEWNGKKQLTIQSVEPYAGKASDLIPRTPFNVELLATAISNRVARMKCPLLKLICTEALLKQEKEWELFKECPGGMIVHHCYAGGLIEHVDTMIQKGDALAPLEGLDPDFIAAGILFHDIGKLWEYRWTPVIERTDRGQLYGHMALGFQYLTRKGDGLKEFAAGHPTQQFCDYIAHLNHVILSHHEKPEWGAVVAPQTREAKLIARIDVMDAQSWRERHLIEESDTDRVKYDRYLGASLYSFPTEYPAESSK
jgi:3'-5' exoribonuclease